jgi:hypothetical protein
MVYLSDHYRPELHYMRGPGPKWLEKHVGQLRANVIAGEGSRHPKNPTFMRRIQLSLRRWFPARSRVRRTTHEVQCDLSDRLGPWAV